MGGEEVGEGERGRVSGRAVGRIGGCGGAGRESERERARIHRGLRKVDSLCFETQ